MNKSRAAWSVAILSAIGDSASTIYAISTGPFREGNPAMAWAISELGLISVVIMHVLALGAVYPLWRELDENPWTIPLAIGIVWTLATVWNCLLLLGALQ